MTFSDLYAMVFRLMRDTGQTKYDLPTVKKWLNDAEQRYCSLTGYSVKKDTSITTVSGTAEYALPSDWKSPIAVFLGVNNDPLGETDVELAQWVSAGTPISYYVRNDKLGLYPTPAAADTVTLIYRSIGGDMSATDDTPIIPEEHHIGLVYYACALCSMEGDDDRFNVFNGKWNEMVAMGKEEVVAKSFASFPVAGEQVVSVPRQPDRDWQGV